MGTTLDSILTVFRINGSTYWVYGIHNFCMYDDCLGRALIFNSQKQISSCFNRKLKQMNMRHWKPFWLMLNGYSTIVLYSMDVWQYFHTTSFMFCYLFHTNHVCILFELQVHSKLTAVAKSLLRMLKHEMNEIDVCPDCYLNSIIKFNDYWFCEPCVGLFFYPLQFVLVWIAYVQSCSYISKIIREYPIPWYGPRCAVSHIGLQKP